MLRNNSQLHPQKELDIDKSGVATITTDNIPNGLFFLKIASRNAVIVKKLVKN
jgi:hypothetical protein